MIAVTPEKCTLRSKGTKVSFRMKEFLYRDFELLEKKRPLLTRSKLLNEAVSLLILKYDGLIVDTTDLPLLTMDNGRKPKRPTKRKAAAAKKVKAKKRK